MQAFNTASEELSNIAIEASVWNLEGAYSDYKGAYLSAGDYKLLEPYRQKKKIPLKITFKVLIKGSTNEIEMHVENVAKKADSRSCYYMNNFTARQRYC